MKILPPIALAIGLAACDNPGAISDQEYAKYNERGAPKILYSCAAPMPFIKKVAMACPDISSMPEAEQISCVEKATKRFSDPNEKIPSVGMVSGKGTGATYNYILDQAQHECAGDFKILESKQ
ncbi:MAG: hypothetical protein Q7R66_09535 [Undibacterium sp.]|uniref:hypothetical protein n=1 Tax=Undibacterium sp. TaxID=1914977 RepID=UPI00271AAF65|nr:hypothetical protein [Undibacterium sp.]MDO8652418.1 hypothetical protein [Undibacterium sp.]